MGYAKSEATRTRLLAAAASLIRDQGYHATGLSEVVAVSGVPKGSLYHHFPGGKEELAIAGIRYGGEQVVDSVARLVDRAGGVAPGVAAFCDHYIDSLGQSGFRAGCPMATITLEAAAEVEGIQQASGRVFTALVDLIADGLREEGVASGVARRAAETVVSAIEGALVVARATRSTQVVATVRDQLVGWIADLEREPR